MAKPKLTPRQKAIIRSFGLNLPDETDRSHHAALVAKVLSTMPEFSDSDVAFVSLVAAEEKQHDHQLD